jgi:DNA-binding NarL/FixJ family response regulator
VSDTHHELNEDLKHCPALTGNARQRATQADTDARRLAADIRDLDPRVIWGRINRWNNTNPQRVLAALVSLAAMTDPDHIPRIDPPYWTVDIGGTAALHPDYRANELAPAQLANASRHRDDIVRLAEAGQLTNREIALRLGIRETTVSHVRRQTGARHSPPGSRAKHDDEIAELDALGYSTEQIAEAVGCSLRTVERARQRIAAAENAA